MASLPNSGPIFKPNGNKFEIHSYKVFQYALFAVSCVAHDNDAMAAFMNANYETPGEVHAGRDAPAAPRPREAVGAAFARAFATWTAPTREDAPSPLAAVFRDLPLELTAKCVMAAMGLRWKPICDKIRKHSYAIQNEQYLMPPLEYPVFEPVRSGVLRMQRHRRDQFSLAGLLARVRPRLLRHHLRPREGRAATKKDVSIVHVYILELF